MLRDLVDGKRTISTWLATRRFRRRFRKAPAFAIAELPEDTFGKLRGAAQPLDAPMSAPVSGRPCVYWVLEVLQDFGADFPTVKAVRDQRGVPFVIEQEGARALVAADGAEVSLVFDHESRSYGATNADRLQKAIVDSYLAHRDLATVEHLVFREAIIEVGETVAILGSGTREPDPDAPPTAAYREGGRTRLRLTSSAKHPLCITDDPRCT